MTEHENWLRYHSLVQAREINKYAKTDAVIEEATKIFAFITGRPKAEILKLADPNPTEKELKP